MNWLLVQELLAAFLLAGIAQWVGTQIAYYPARRLPPDAHWTERARRSWSARLLISLAPAILLGVTITLSGTKFGGWDRILRTIFVPICVMLGATLGGWQIARRIAKRPLRYSDLLREYAVSFLILSPGTIILMVMLLVLIPRSLDATSIGIMAGSFIAVVALAFGLTVPLARAIGLLAPPPPRFLEIVKSASEAANVPPPPVYLLRWHQANALAFPFARLLAFTGPAMEILTDRELKAVCLHEIAHLQESTVNKLMRLSGIVVAFPLFTFPVWSKSFGIPGILVPIGIFFIGNRLLQKFCQRMEHAADAAAYSGGDADDSAGYARALEKIYEFNVVPAVLRGKSQSHPHLYDRMIAAGLTPAYPRPKAPSLPLFLFTAFFVMIATIMPLQILATRTLRAEVSSFHEDSSEEFGEVEEE